MSLNVSGTVLNVDPAWNNQRAATLPARSAISILLPRVTEAPTHRIHLISASELKCFLKAILNIFCVTWKTRSFPVLDLSLQNLQELFYFVPLGEKGRIGSLTVIFLGKDLFKPLSFDCKETTTNKRHVSS